MRRQILVLIAVLLAAIQVQVFAGGTGEARVKQKVLILYGDENRQVMYKDYYLKNIKAALPNYDVEFEIGASDQPTYLAKLRTYLSSGDMPDVFFSLGTSVMSPLMQAKALLPLDDYFKSDGFANRYNKIERYQHTDGRIYALEAGWDFYFGTIMYYNKDIFDKYGLSVPKTWDDFISVCKELRKNDVTPLAVAGKELWIAHLMDMVTYAGDPKAVEKLATGKLKMTDPIFLDAAKRVRQLYEIKAFQEGASNYNWGDTDAYFRAQKAAMLLVQTWSLFTYVTGENPLKFNFGWMTFPSATPGLDLSRTYPLHYDPLLGFSVYSKTKNPKDSVKLLEWLVDQDARWGIERAKMPVELDVGMKLQNVPPILQKWMDDITKASYTYSEFGNHFSASAINEFDIQMAKLMNGDIMPDEFIREADKALALQ